MAYWLWQGIFIADRKVNRHDARGTRQNNNGNRRGLECPEERDYYPYWTPTPWRDVAILVDDARRCDYFKKASNNVQKHGECVAPNATGITVGASIGLWNPATKTFVRYAVMAHTAMACTGMAYTAMSTTTSDITLCAITIYGVPCRANRGFVDKSRVVASGAMDHRSTYEKFRVEDAGSGLVALYSDVHKNYLQVVMACIVMPYVDMACIVTALWRFTAACTRTSSRCVTGMHKNILVLAY